MIAKFYIVGKPVGKGRPRFSKNGSVYTPEATRAYEERVKAAYINQCGNAKFTGAIQADITAYFEIPKSVSKSKRNLLIDSVCTKKPDCDNIAKIILDAINGIAYNDDAQVGRLIVHKKYTDGEAGVMVIIGGIYDIT